MTDHLQSPEAPNEALILSDIRQLVEAARHNVASKVNAEQVLLYWRVGQRIHSELLGNRRAKYGAQIVSTLSTQLVGDYGRTFAERNLRRMIQFAETFSDTDQVIQLSQGLSWSHFVELLPLKDPLQRDFYAEMCRVERWAVHTLRKKMASMLYERTALSRKPEALAENELKALREHDQLSPNLVFRDPYFLDFLGLEDTYAEKDLESAILRELESFIMELGAGFTFVARQKRITIDGDDFYIDLLMYHRDLRRLVAIELKLDKFRPEHKGQIELYLRWLNRYERKAGEESPLGIILCSDKNDERVELLELDKTGIHVAEYLTILPPKDVLKQRLHAAIERSKARLAQRSLPDASD